MSNYDYKVTMIVPIYNMGKFLADCLDSLVKQTITPEEMEILLIDDGSTDNSIDIMREYASHYPNIKIHRKENEGLPKTRNYGIARAKGKYIMYIDADDTISPDTVKSVTDFFDKHYDEVDLVTYKEYPIINGKKGIPHYRFQTLVNSGVYDLMLPENAFIAQTNINVCVKNMGKDNVLFDSNREFRHEDQKYCIEVVRKKMKIGYCSKGVYYYLHQPESIVRTFFYAYYIFESTMKFWEDTFAYYEDGLIPQYIQAMYISDIAWKMTSDILLPYHYEPEKLEIAKQRITRLLDKVDDEIILRHPIVDSFHRQFFISLRSNNNIKVLTGVDQVAIANYDKLIYFTQKIEIVVQRYKIVDEKIRISAFIKSAVFNYLDKPDLYLVRNKNNSKLEKIELRESSKNYYKAKTKTNSFWNFEIEIDLKGLNSFEFKVEIEGKLYGTRYYFMPLTYFDFGMKRLTHYYKDKKISYSAGVFYVKKVSKAEKREYVKLQKGKYRKSNREIWKLRRLCMKKIKRYSNVWLYHSDKGVERDSAYYQFEHDIVKKDGVRRYYVINEEEYSKVNDCFPRKYRKYMVRFGSWKHKYFFLIAKKMITTVIEWNNFAPFLQGDFKKFMEVTNLPELIYLQQGIRHNHAPWEYSLDRLVIDKEVISTQYEKENLIRNYCFYEDALLPVGIPRYDFIDVNKKANNRILFAPSWRKYLVGQEKPGKWITIESKFLNSKFFEETEKFLNSKELEKMLEDYNMYLDFKLHPILERYKDLYKITNTRVAMAKRVVDETEYEIFMTDFSSYVYDFVYLERPIIYFLPDDEMFRSGMHDYRELDIPFENGFGELALTAEEALKALHKILSNDCRTEQKYAERMKDFFLFKDNNQRQRIYDALMGADKKCK